MRCRTIHLYVLKDAYNYPYQFISCGIIFPLRNKTGMHLIINRFENREKLVLVSVDMKLNMEIEIKR